MKIEHDEKENKDHGRSPVMERFEYKCVFIWGGGEKTSRILNEYGEEGWELVTTWSFWHYLKRPLG